MPKHNATRYYRQAPPAVKGNPGLRQNRTADTLGLATMRRIATLGHAHLALALCAACVHHPDVRVQVRSLPPGAEMRIRQPEAGDLGCTIDLGTAPVDATVRLHRAGGFVEAAFAGHETAAVFIGDSDSVAHEFVLLPDVWESVGRDPRRYPEEYVEEVKRLLFRCSGLAWDEAGARAAAADIRASMGKLGRLRGGSPPGLVEDVLEELARRCDVVADVCRRNALFWDQMYAAVQRSVLAQRMLYAVWRSQGELARGTRGRAGPPAQDCATGPSGSGPGAVPLAPSCGPVAAIASAPCQPPPSAR